MAYKDLLPSEQLLYLESLSSLSNRTDYRISVYDRNEVFREMANFGLNSGQVDADIGNTIRRAMIFTSNDLDWNPAGDLFYGMFIGAEFGLYVDGLNTWVWDFVFKGPVVNYTSNGRESIIECQSKEVLMMPPIDQALPGKPDNKQIATYIRTVATANGETLFNLGDLGGKLTPNDFDTDPNQATSRGNWWYLVDLCDAADFSLFYSVDGYLTSRPKDLGDVITYAWPDYASGPGVEENLLELSNRVEVYGKQANGGGNQLKGYAQLPDNHRLSPEALARNGKKLTLTKRITSRNTSLSTIEANRIAEAALADAISFQQQVAFESTQVPFLELQDRCSVQMNGAVLPFELNQYSLPLEPGPMAVGYLKPKPFVDWEAEVKSGSRR